MNLRKPVKVFVGAMTALLALFPLIILPAGSALLLFSFGFPFADPQSAPSLEEFGGVLIPAGKTPRKRRTLRRHERLPDGDRQLTE